MWLCGVGLGGHFLRQRDYAPQNKVDKEMVGVWEVNWSAHIVLISTPSNTFGMDADALVVEWEQIFAARFQNSCGKHSQKSGDDYRLSVILL